jgi:hypothetical protein
MCVTDPSLKTHQRSNISFQAGPKNLTVPIVDFFVDTDVKKVGVSLPGFLHFGTEDDGIIPNVTWSIV